MQHRPLYNILLESYVCEPVFLTASLNSYKNSKTQLVKYTALVNSFAGYGHVNLANWEYRKIGGTPGAKLVYCNYEPIEYTHNAVWGPTYSMCNQFSCKTKHTYYRIPIKLNANIHILNLEWPLRIIFHSFYHISCAFS